MPHIEEIDDMVNDLNEDDQDEDEGIVATREKCWVAPMITLIICKITASESSAIL